MKRLLKVILLLIVLIIVLLAVVLIVGGNVSFDAPARQSVGPEHHTLEADSGFVRCGESRMRRSSDGLWELYLQGTPEERGADYATLAGDLIRHQEDIFIERIRSIIPSDTYIAMLQRVVLFFNRHLDQYFPDEYKREIYEIAQANTHEYDFIGDGYLRQLNYHAAHDIGHAMQDYMLVGCSSFAAWGAHSADSSLVVGRNFDFYFGSEFAENKIIMIVRPTEGIPFVSVSWPAFVGVASGMNANGLSVTINAAKGEIPTTARTPISILARQILQYASNIDEAVQIAKQFETFVSESILVAADSDNRAVVIEKSPDKTAVYQSDSDYVLCTNHYQSADFAHDANNLENIATSDSKYRLERADELVKRYSPIDYADAVAILRDRRGKSDADIGIGNEKSINQFICHHSVVFRPHERLMFVSTAPWQAGKYVCYDLHRLFAGADFSGEIAEHQRDVPASDTLVAEAAQRLTFDRLSALVRAATDSGTAIAASTVDSLVMINPNYFRAYEIVGDYYKAQNQKDKAAEAYRKALTLEIPHLRQREEIGLKSRESKE